MEERSALYNLTNDKNIVIKSAGKGCSTVVIWDSDDYIKEGEKKLGDKDLYKKVHKDLGTLISTIHEAIEKTGKRRNLNADKTKYFMIKVYSLLLAPENTQTVSRCSRSTNYFKPRSLCLKYIFLFRLSFATIGPGSKISSGKWSNPVHFLKSQGKFCLSFPCTLFYIFLTPKVINRV